MPYPKSALTPVERNRKNQKAYRERHPERYKKASYVQNLRVKYGLTFDDYEAMVAAQGGVCAICGKPCSSGRRLSVDHNHITGAVRGLLCGRCNRALGVFEQDNSLEALVTYALQHGIGAA